GKIGLTVLVGELGNLTEHPFEAFVQLGEWRLRSPLLAFGPSLIALGDPAIGDDPDFTVRRRAITDLPPRFPEIASLGVADRLNQPASATPGKAGLGTVFLWRLVLGDVMQP